MKRVFLRQALVVVSALAGLLVFPAANAEDEAPDALIKRLSVDVLDAINSDKAIRAGDTARVVALVDTHIMPNVNFQRMTASAVGPAWRQARCASGFERTPARETARPRPDPCW